MRHFLVTRKVDLGLAKIEVFDDQTKALKAYEAAEQRIEAQVARRRERGQVYGAPPEVCLFGADRLGTLLKTHASWFDEPVDEDLFRELAHLALASREQQG